MTDTNKTTAALTAIEALDLRQLKQLREYLDSEVDRRTAVVASGDPEYPRAVRECLIDCEAFLLSARQGRLRHEHMGQLDVLLRDMRNLVNREDVETYKYKKVT